MTRSFHKFWLLISGLVVASFAPVFFLGTMHATSEPVRWTVDLLAWPPDGATSWDHHETRFLSALTAGFLLGWGVTILALRAWVYDAAPEGVRRSILVGVLAWFVLDGAGSITSGTASNALFNVAVLLLAVGPLWRPAVEDRAAMRGAAT